MTQSNGTELVWLVTGCSVGGFGEHFVAQVLARGDRVIATARNTAKIAELKSAGAAILQLDVTDSQSNLDSIIAEAISIYGRIDVLVNNAAYIQTGTLEGLQHEELERQFATNVFGTMKVTRALLPHFRSRQKGFIVLISSLSGWIGHPGCGAYAASKFAIEGLAESLRAETSPLGIKTLLIEPGRFRTKLLSSDNMQAAKSNISDYATFSADLAKNLSQEDAKQPGDPTKLVNIVLDLIRQEGVSEGKELPFRLPLGIDVFDDMKQKCTDTLALLENWKEVIRSTNHE